MMKNRNIFSSKDLLLTFGNFKIRSRFILIFFNIPGKNPYCSLKDDK